MHWETGQVEGHTVEGEVDVRPTSQPSLSPFASSARRPPHRSSRLLIAPSSLVERDLGAEHVEKFFSSDAR